MMKRNRMESLRRTAIVIFAVFFCSVFPAGASGSAGGDKQEIRKTFKNKTSVRINTISGDCVVKKGTPGAIGVYFVHTYANHAFQPRFEEEGGTLILQEKLALPGKGDSTWHITVPEKTDIHFNSISGDFSVEDLESNIYARSYSGKIRAWNCKGDLVLIGFSGSLDLRGLSGKMSIRGISSDLKIGNLSGEITVKTASGDIEAEQLEGTVSIKTPGGDIDIKNAKGSFEVKSASGDIDAAGIILTSPGYFRTSSGSVHVTLARGADYDLTLATVSGDAVLNYNGNPLEGCFEFKTSPDRGGEIIAPFPFDREEETEKWGKTCVIKSFRRMKDTPGICIHTVVGKAILKEK